MTRGRIAVIILVLWGIGLALLGVRQLRKTDWERLAEAAPRIEPTDYYYTVHQGRAQVGIASSVIDTVASGLRATDVFSGRLVIYGDTQSVVGSAVSYLSRRLALDSFALSVRSDQKPSTLRGAPKQHLTPVFLPDFVSVPFMLTGSPKVGREEHFWIYNPLAQDVQRTTLRIQAESLFTVSDSARFDSTVGRWVSAHQDTVRAWSMTAGTSGITAWVDAQGRLVSASEPGGLHLIRTSYEEAFSNWRNAKR